MTEKVDIANELNNFFVNQPKDLLHEHDLGSDPDPESIDPNSLSSESALNIPHITNKEVAEILVSIPPHKATGDDGISAKLLRIAVNSISNSLHRLINHCIVTATFPSKWKIAKVTPIFKGQGSKDEKCNYRPISVLPILSKVFERHICKSFYEHLKSNDMLHKLQSGFRNHIQQKRR